MKVRTLLATAAVAAFALVGCGGGSADPDATPGAEGGAGDASITGDVSGDRAAPSDARAETGSGTALFGQCTSNAQCGTGRTCDLTFPGGLCTRTCTQDAQCGDGICSTFMRQQCYPRCSPGGGECAANQVCVGLDQADDTRGTCLGACDPMAAAGSPLACGGTAPMCNPYVIPTCAAAVPTTGGDNGAPCAGRMDCKGACLAEVGDMGPTGFIGGQCYSFGRLPDPNTAYAPNQPLPRGNCPTGSIVLPLSDTAVEGDYGVCLQGCTPGMPNACRPGYFCQQLGPAGMQTSTGFCDPIDCLIPAQGACPTGYTCRTIPPTMAGGMPTGRCEAPGTGGDAGTPGDASAPGDGG